MNKFNIYSKKKKNGNPGQICDSKPSHLIEKKKEI